MGMFAELTPFEAYVLSILERAGSPLDPSGLLEECNRGCEAKLDNAILYSALTPLAQKGCILESWKTDSSGRERRYRTISGYGRLALSEHHRNAAFPRQREAGSDAI
jgi:DNA-binding PadR family transcriptional regulator